MVNQTGYAQTLTIEEFFSRENIERLNSSKMSLSQDIKNLEYLKINQRVNGNVYYLLIFLYVMVMVGGFIQNISIIVACIRNKLMKTPRNILISNMAFSDIFLCLFTMPLTLLDLIHWWWPIGSGQMTSTTQSTFVFFASFSVVIIAMDRMRFVVTPQRVQLSNKMGFLLSFLGLVLSILFSYPLFCFTKIEVLFKDASYCYESFPSVFWRKVYAVFSLSVQFLLPCLLVTVAYLRVYFTFSKSQRRLGRHVSQAPSATSIRKKNRSKRTNLLLTLISFVFFLSWAPLNIFIVVINTVNPIQDEESLVLMFAVCHLVGMSTTCTNPILYAWLNRNFRSPTSCCQHTRSMNQEADSFKIFSSTRKSFAMTTFRASRI